MKTCEHLLICLMEECGEVIQAASKTLRFGPDDKHPKGLPINREYLRQELSALTAVSEMLDEEMPFFGDNWETDKAAKKAKLRRMMECLKSAGMLS